MPSLVFVGRLKHIFFLLTIEGDRPQFWRAEIIKGKLVSLDVEGRTARLPLLFPQFFSLLVLGEFLAPRFLVQRNPFSLIFSRTRLMSSMV